MSQPTPAPSPGEMGDGQLSEEARKCVKDACKPSAKLSEQAKKWVEDALKPSSKRSADIVKRAATSLARNQKMKEEMQNGVWKGYLLLHYAARNGCELLFRLLLEEFRVDPNLLDPFTRTSTLHHAAAAGNKKMLQALLKTYLCDTEARDFGGSTPICIAVACGQNPALRMLLKFKASIDVESYLGMPIHSATYVGNTEAVRILHESKPDAVNAELYGFCTPLVAAALYDSTDCFKYLAEVADINVKHLFYKVICYSDSEELVKERIDILLKREANPNLFDQDVLFEELPILCAAKRGWKKVVKTLLEPTDQIPEVNDWSVGGVIEYVNSHEFKENNHVEREPRVDALKKRLIQELRQKHFLAADLICKTLRVDMDREHWDWVQSLCSFLIMYGARSMFLDCEIATINLFGSMLLSEGDDDTALLAAKACMALDPEEVLCKDFYDEVKEKMQKKEELEKAKQKKNRRASGSRRR